MSSGYIDIENAVEGEYFDYRLDIELPSGIVIKKTIASTIYKPEYFNRRFNSSEKMADFFEERKAEYRTYQQYVKNGIFESLSTVHRRKICPYDYSRFESEQQMCQFDKKDTYQYTIEKDDAILFLSHDIDSLIGYFVESALLKVR